MITSSGFSLVISSLMTCGSFSFCVNNTGAFSLFARLPATKLSAKFSPLASTTVFIWFGNVCWLIFADVLYRSTPLIVSTLILFCSSARTGVNELITMLAVRITPKIFFILPPIFHTCFIIYGRIPIY